MTLLHMKLIGVPHAGTTFSETFNYQKTFGLSLKIIKGGVVNYSQKVMLGYYLDHWGKLFWLLF